MWKWYLISPKTPKLPPDHRSTHDVCAVCAGSGEGESHIKSITVLGLTLGVIYGDQCPACEGAGYVQRPRD